jgi:hypothetical protein
LPDHLTPHLPNILPFSIPAIHSEEVFEQFALLDRLLKPRYPSRYSEKEKKKEEGEKTPSQISLAPDK